MKIALLTHSLRPRGGVVHTLELAEALMQRGHRVTVIAAAEQGETLFREVRHEMALIRLPVLGRDLVGQVRQRIDCLTDALPALLAGRGFDLVHAQDSLSGNALATLRERGELAMPWLRTVHHLDVFEEPLLNEWQDRAWRAADGIACVSDGWAARLPRAERMFNGVNLARYSMTPAPGDAAALAALGIEPGDRYLLLVGGVEARKNTVRLLQAFAQLREPSLRLVIAGGASMLDHSAARAAWQEELQALGLREGRDAAVLRTGPLPDALMPALMRGAQALAMPSLVEGFGLVALEALACGTPVLVSRLPPFTEHLTGCASVAWCEPEDTGSIAEGLRDVLVQPRPTAPPTVCLTHSWTRSAQLHEDWYRRHCAALVD